MGQLTSSDTRRAYTRNNLSQTIYWPYKTTII